MKISTHHSIAPVIGKTKESIVLLLVLLLSATHWSTALAQGSPPPGIGYTFNLSSGKLSILGSTTATDYTITKEGVDMAIGKNKRTDIKSVTINVSGSITAIGNEAFMECDNLTTITLPATLTSIGDRAFSKCRGITGTLTLPVTLKTIGDRAFDECRGITGTLTLPASLETLGFQAFVSCTGIKKADLSQATKLTAISEGAFNCCGITEISLHARIATIDPAAFGGCTRLTTLDLSDAIGLTTIKTAAFYFCFKLSTLTLPGSVSTIGEEAFNYCSALVTINTLGTTPPTLGSMAFAQGPNPNTRILNVPNASSGFGEDNQNDWGAKKIIYKTTNITGAVSESFSIYPNPTAGVLNVRSEAEVSLIEVFDVAGRKQLEWAKGKSVDVGGLNRGNYFVRVHTANGVVTEKFVKE